MENAADTITRLAAELRHKAYKAYLASPPNAMKTEGQYRRQVWRVIRDLYNGEIDEFSFLDDMNSFIDNQFTRAWNAGAREMGVNPNQYTDEDITALADLMKAEQGYMLQLADDIMKAKAQGGSLDQFKPRADMWANRYNEIVNTARVHFGGKQMLEWVYSPDKEHCADCERLNGIVASAEDWGNYRLAPQSRDLACGGWRCGCDLKLTSKPPTEGGIPG